MGHQRPSTQTCTNRMHACRLAREQKQKEEATLQHLGGAVQAWVQAGGRANRVRRLHRVREVVVKKLATSAAGGAFRAP